MYSDWASLLPEIQSESGDQSVLARFNYNTGREVVGSVVRNLCSNMTKCAEGLEANLLLSDNDVTWTMEIICFGLSLPATDRETTLDCVSIYCEWMTCLTEPCKSIPGPLLEEPNKYFCQMLIHFTNLFKQRNDSNAEYMGHHINMCNKVLKMLQIVSSKSRMLTPESWVSLLKFLLTSCDSLLSPPSTKDDLGSRMCEKMLNVLFETWLVSCGSGHFPSPSLWKTMHEMCLGWRHHEALVTQWHKINSFLTSQLLKMFHGPGYQTQNFSEDDAVMSFTSNDVVIQCWFRFLHLIGNPVDFSRPRVISSTQRFLHAALSSRDVVEPHQHGCLEALPQIFLKAMKSISLIAAAFLGSSQKNLPECDCSASTLSSCQSSEQPFVTPPPARKPQRVTSFFPHLIKNKDASSRMSLGETWPAAGPLVSNQPAPTPVASESVGMFSSFRPKVNSLLHLLGSWLFDSSLVGVDVAGSRKEEDWGNENLHHCEAGRAQACGCLCRIFSSVKTDEDILRAYVSRFYTVLYYGLKYDQESAPNPVLISIVLNSSDIFKVNLIGSQVLIPQYLRAIEFLQTKFRYKHETVDEDADLRYATIQLLLSFVCLPLHFRNLEIKKILDDEKIPATMVTFYSLQHIITSLFLKLLSKEIDPVNTQTLLGGVALLVADMATFEEHSNSSEGSSQLFDLYDRATVTICDRLIKSWTSELTSALTAMEVLQFFSTFGSLKSRFRRKKENDDISLLTNAALEANSKKIVVMMCDFVVHQCSKPAIYHSKDLHSSIVLAYQCLTSWLVEHDYLLQDGAVLHTVLQVTELGISGSRSQARPTDAPLYKGSKELKPISLRVKDAAEALLAAIVDHVGSFPPPSGPESLCTLLDEESFLTKFDQASRPKFQYFVVDGSVILGLFEPPTDGVTATLPHLVAVTRSLFGRHAWLLKLCRQSKLESKNPTVTTPPSGSGPDGVGEGGVHPRSSVTPASVPQYFPDSVAQTSPVLADVSIPPISKTMASYEEQLQSMRSILEEQKTFEDESCLDYEENYKPPPPCQPPSSTKISNAARLFLSHFGFLTLDNLKAGSTSNSMLPALNKLNDSNASLWSDLKSLDMISVRTADVVHVYYVKPGQKRLEDMLANALPGSDLNPHFVEFLLSVGWPVDVRTHPGWTGNPSMSWKVKEERNPTVDDRTQTTDGTSFDGTSRVLYWADVTTELVFTVPSPNSVTLKDIPHDPAKVTEGDANASVSFEGETLKLRRSGRVGGHGSRTDIQVVVVWLEHYEDHSTFPIADLARMTNHQQVAEYKTQQKPPTLNSSNFCIIFIHPLLTGLFRIHLHTSSSKVGDAGPLVDGVVVSRRILGQAVRQTAYNIYRRKTLESDAHQPPHVKRRIFIKEIIQRHTCPMTESDFCTSLFHS